MGGLCHAKIRYDVPSFEPTLQGRPNHYQRKNSDKGQIVPHDPNCPFCPGNESMTPPSLLSFDLSNPSSSSSWSTRVIENKYPVVWPLHQGQVKEEEISESYLLKSEHINTTISAVGYHEVVNP